MERPQYKTWIRTRPLVIFASLVAGSLVAALLGAWQRLFLVFLVPAAIFGYILLIVGLSRWRFTPAGGDYQARVHQLIVSRVAGARILDIGCGSGHLLAQIARAHPSAELVGLDYWGADWEYSQGLCESNFRAEGLAGRARFVHGSASELPADLGEFDCIVSCLTFHEVADAADKTVSLSQAIGRLRAGGRFVFVDLFGSTGYYPRPSAIEAAIVESGGRVTERVPLGELMALRFPLRHKRVLGHAQLIAGERPAKPRNAA